MAKKDEKVEYEFMGIVKPFLPEDVRETLLKKVKGLFVSAGGKILKEDIWGKRHLAYKMKGHEEGYYVLYILEFPTGKADEVKSDLNLENDLLRYILIRRN